MSMYSESVRAFLKPVIAFLDDPEVTEIMINGPTDIWIEKGGKVFKTEAQFTDDGLTAAARNVSQFVGRVLSDERPRVDARLPDGSRIHIVLPPIARKGTTIAIRKFFKDKLTVDRLIGFGACTPQMARLIDACVKLKLNIVVSGGTGSGKTTLLNVVSRFIPEDERILTIEDSAELQMQQPHLVSFESRPPDKFGKGEVSLGDLLNSALRLRPDRIVVGEVRGGECFYLLQAMNTGHGGSLATTHANTPTDTLRRLESLCLMSGIELPMVAIRAQVASAINLIICCERLNDGSRKITHVSEVLPLNEKGDYRTQDLFVYTLTGKDQKTGKVQGYHAPTGILPGFLDRLKAYGFGDCDEKFFDPASTGAAPPPVFTHDEVHRTRWAPSLRHREAGAAHAAPPPMPEPVTQPAAAFPFPTPPAFPHAMPSPAVLQQQPGILGSTLTETPLPKHLDNLPPFVRVRDPQPSALPSSLLTEDTPQSGVKAPEFAEEDDDAPPVPGHDTDPRIHQASTPPAAPPLDEDDNEDTSSDRTVDELEAQGQVATVEEPEEPKPEPVRAKEEPKAAEKHPPKPAGRVVDEPTIQIAEDLLEEVERAVVNEQTYVKKNPLMKEKVPTPPPAVRLGNKGGPRKKRDEDEKTDPHIRMPTK